MEAKNSTDLGLVILMAKPCQKARHQPSWAAASSAGGPSGAARHSVTANQTR